MDDLPPERKTFSTENVAGTPDERLATATPTTCIETIDGDPDTALRLSFQIKVF